MTMSSTMDVEECHQDLWRETEESVQNILTIDSQKEHSFMHASKPLRDILIIFEKHQVKSTFFIVGKIEVFLDIEKEIRAFSIFFSLEDQSKRLLYHLRTTYN